MISLKPVRSDEPQEPVESGASMYHFVKSRESSARTYANAIDRVIERGLGSYVYDTEGRKYLDSLTCAATLATGHNHPHVLRKVREFLDSGHVLQALDITTPAKYRFLKQLIDCLPPSFAPHARVQFCGPAGADATEAALKLFKTVTGRRTVLAFHGGYHGMTAGALALTGNLTAKNHVASLMPDVHFLPYPYSYRCPFGLGGARTEAASLAYIERVLTDPESGIPRPAAIILEAVQGEGGVIPASRAWLQGLRRLTAELDIPLIFDEIQSGFGRTGNMFAFEYGDVTPDAILVSKAVGGGFPMSLMLYHEKYDRWTPGAHAGTFRGNQIAMVAGAAALEVIVSEKLVEGALTKGEYLKGKLVELQARFPAIGEVRGRGLMWGLEIVNADAPADALGSRVADGKLAKSIKRQCLEHGLIIETGGRHGAVLRLLPPLTLSYSELDELVEKLGQALAAATSQP